jgi:uncharacterized protein (DUF433 family)
MVNNYVNSGVYTLTEAALYGTLSSQKLSRWLFGTMQNKPVITSQFVDEHLVSFYDLIQAMAINKARQAKVSLTKIRQAIKFAQDTYGVDLPLAYNHELWLFYGDLDIKFPNREPVQISGSQRGQSLMNQIVEPFKSNLTFDVNGLVVLYEPYKKYGRSIVLDPKKQFGQPVVSNTGYRADVLDNAYMAECSYQIAASEYGVDVKDVKIAVEYITKLRAA